jgi:hypothetical protein
MRHGLVTTVVGGLITGFAAAPATAQPAGRVGVTMGAPTSVGIVWHLGTRVAIRHEVSLTRTSSEFTTTIFTFGQPQVISTTTKTWNTTAGASALLYLRDIDRLRLYLAPRAAYLLASVENESSTAAPGLGTLSSGSSGVAASGSFGAQYGPHDRFGIFGEVGVAYSRQKGDTGLARTETELRSVGLRSGIGVVVYF